MSAKKILVVDDEPDIVTMVETRLQANGYDVVTGQDGEEAMKLTKEVHPDLIILDVMMPPPNGLQVCRTLKDDPQYKDIPVILLTAKGTDSDQFWGMESGADEYITKPYNADELLKKISTLITR